MPVAKQKIWIINNCNTFESIFIESNMKLIESIVINTNNFKRMNNALNNW